MTRMHRTDKIPMAVTTEGLTNAEIADRLQLQTDSVRKTVSRVLSKLGVRERVGIAVLWYQSGMDG